MREERQGGGWWLDPEWHAASPATEHPPPSVGAGMTWSGFRPSDDASHYGFPIAANMYAAAGLERALELNRQIWQVAEFEAKASRLLAEIKSGGATRE